jgi:hypothetical protein
MLEMAPLPPGLELAAEVPVLGEARTQVGALGHPG